MALLALCCQHIKHFSIVSAWYGIASSLLSTYQAFLHCRHGMTLLPVCCQHLKHFSVVSMVWHCYLFVVNISSISPLPAGYVTATSLLSTCQAFLHSRHGMSLPPVCCQHVKHFSIVGIIRYCYFLVVNVSSISQLSAWYGTVISLLSTYQAFLHCRHGMALLFLCCQHIKHFSIVGMAWRTATFCYQHVKHFSIVSMARRTATSLLSTCQAFLHCRHGTTLLPLVVNMSSISPLSAWYGTAISLSSTINMSSISPLSAWHGTAISL
jgi:hypothetical protein